MPETKIPKAKARTRKPRAVTEPVAVAGTAPAVVEVAPSIVEAAPAPAPIVEAIVQAAIEPIVEALPEITTAVEATANTASKETEPMTTTETATAKAQTMFTEMNSRAKAAMEKSTTVFAELNEFGKGNLEAVVESAKIAAKGFESLGQEAADYSRRSFEGATAALKNLSSVRTPTDFFKLHSDYVRSTFDAMVAEGSRSTEALLKLAGEVAQPISNRAAIAAEKIKLAA